MSAPVLRVPAERPMLRGSYTPRGGVPRGFYWDPSKGGEVVLDPEPAPLRMHHVAVGAGGSAVAVGAPVKHFGEISLDRPSKPADGAIYFDRGTNSFMVRRGGCDGRHGEWMPVAGPSGAGRRQAEVMADVVATEERISKRIDEAGESLGKTIKPSARAAGAHCVCLAEGCTAYVTDGDVFCRACALEERSFTAIFCGLVGLCLAIRGATLVGSVSQDLQAFYLLGMFLIGFKACRLISRGRNGR